MKINTPGVFLALEILFVIYILAGHFRGRDSQNERMAMLPAEGGNQVKFQYSNL